MCVSGTTKLHVNLLINTLTLREFNNIDLILGVNLT